MNKNIVIGVLVVLILGFGGYYLMQNNAGNQSNTTTNTNTQTPVVKTPTPVSPTPEVPLKPDAPVVQTFINPNVSNSTATVNGQVKPNGSSTEYWFEYGENTALGSRTVTQQVGSGYYLTPTPAYITGLRSNTIYYFRLSAKNSFATVNGDTFSFQTNTNPPSPALVPAAHTNSATSVSRMTANINGAVNPNGSEATYWFEYGKDSNLGNVTSIQSSNNSILQSLKCGMIFEYLLSACNSIISTL